MPVFQVSSRSVQEAAPPRKKPRRIRPEWLTIIRYTLALSGAGGIFALLTLFKGSGDTIFILLPVFVYLAAMQFQRFNPKIPGFIPNLILNSTPTYILF